MRTWSSQEQFPPHRSLTHVAWLGWKTKEHKPTLRWPERVVECPVGRKRSRSPVARYQFPYFLDDVVGCWLKADRRALAGVRPQRWRGQARATAPHEAIGRRHWTACLSVRHMELHDGTTDLDRPASAWWCCN